MVIFVYVFFFYKIEHFVGTVFRLREKHTLFTKTLHCPQMTT